MTEALRAAGELPDELAQALPLAAVDALYAEGADEATRVRARELLTRMSPANDRDAERADCMAHQAYRRAQAGRWREAIALVELALVRDDLALSSYCNALYFIQRDDNGLPVDRERASRFLAAGLPHAPKNPAIFFNAACVYVELGEHEPALACIADALKHGYDGCATNRCSAARSPVTRGSRRSSPSTRRSGGRRRRPRRRRRRPRRGSAAPERRRRSWRSQRARRSGRARVPRITNGRCAARRVAWGGHADHD